MPKAGRVLIALSVTALLFLALAVLVQEGRGPTVAKAQGYSYHTLRVYGNGYEGAGDTSKQDPYTKLYPEDPPYTDPEAIFNPQLPQAPRKDSITFNPIFMSEFETFDENHAQGLYNQIFAGTRNATQKVWFRMWYEPWHWDKDVDANGKLELFCTITGCRNLTGTLDEWYPAVMQEFTYMLLEADLLANEPKPLAGQVGRTSFVFPVGMRPYLLFNESGGVDSTSAQARYGWGLTSLDGDFDGIPDIVHVESEWTLFDKTRVAADFNGNGSIDPLDPDTTALNGNELAIFRLGTKPLAVGAKIQFLDHMAIVKAIFINSVQLEIYYLGDMIPVSLGSRTIYVGDMLLSGSSGPGQLIPAGGHNLCDFPTGPWFVYLDSIDRAENKARLMVGRALGATWSAMEDRPFQADTRPGDPWFLKRFYVDGHEYNVVAIMTEGGGQDPWYTAKCPLNDSVPWPPRPEDRTRFKFITIRTPVPKAGTYDDPLIGHPIEQHSVRLQPYAARDRLSVMPPYNHEHYIVPDVQAIQQFTCKEEDVRYCGLSTGMEKQVTAAEEPVKAFDLADRSKSLGEVVPDEVIIRFRSPAAGQLLANRLAVAGQASRWLRDEAMADIEPLPKEILGLQPFAAGQARALQTLRAHAKLSKLAQSLEAGQALARDQVAVVADALYAAMEPDDPMNMFYAQVAEGTDLRELCLALMKRPDVEYANPSRVYYTEGSPNDVNFYRQWNLDRIRMPQAWDSASNTYDPNGVKVCVVDSGVRISHQELSGRTAYPKDVYLANGDAYGNADPNDDDLDGHGTAVAGIIAAKRDNSLGIAGIAPVTIIPVNANGCPVGDGACGKISHFEDGIYWGVEHGAAVINCSFGSYAYAPFPSELAAVNYAASRGVLVVSTSGNTNNEGTTTEGVPKTADNHYPGALPSVLCVAAVDDANERVSKPPWPWGSNYGNSVDVCAPGEGAVGANRDAIPTLGRSSDSAYRFNFNGTSAAAPHVSGLAALLKYVNSSLTADRLRSIIESTARDLVGDPAEDVPGWDPHHGYGLIDAERAIRSLTTPVAVRPVGPVPPIMQLPVPFQGQWPISYQGVGPYSPYRDLAEMSLFYVDEAKNPQFLGELREKYGDDGQDEFWRVLQFHTLPWQYTEFVLPALNPGHINGHLDRYLLTSSFLAFQSEYLLWTQDHPEITQTYNLGWDPAIECWAREYKTDTMPGGWEPRVKFWFDPRTGGKKYKDDRGIRIYGFGSEGPGTRVTDPINPAYPVEVYPYRDPEAPFNPDHPREAPPKDSLTFNPAYMNEFLHSNESLVSLYRQISIRELNAYEKVFLRMWYEPEYLDKILRAESTPPYTPTSVYTFPALMQEYTYMYLDTTNQPASAQPKSSAFAFPMATGAGQLPAPDKTTRNLPLGFSPSFGYGLTTFDANFDGQHDIVHLHSEFSLKATTGITVDFDGDGVIDYLDADGTPLNGNELVVFALEDMVLQRGDSVQFLDHMVTLDNVSENRADLLLWYTGGGLHVVPGGYSLHPDRIGSYSLRTREMAIANRSTVRVLPAGGDNLNSVDGAWFVFVNAINDANETVSLMVGRALGATHSAIDDGKGGHDMTPGDPWYLKRFFVDGHEYNVVAIMTEPAATQFPGDEPYEFKYITIRTPVPKVNFVNRQDSQKLEGYYRGTVFGVDTSIISVMPPFNFDHTGINDVRALLEKDPVTGEFIFGNPKYRDCGFEVMKNLPPYVIRIVDEAREPQFFGELREKYYELEQRQPPEEVWQTEQWHIVPDQYTELQLPVGQKYMLTSSWWAPELEVYIYRCPLSNSSGSTVASQELVAAAGANGPRRVKFWYDPTDTRDIYVNTWGEIPPVPTPTPTRTPTPRPGGTGTIYGTVRLQGRTNHAGVTVRAGSVSATTNSAGAFTLSSVPVGTFNVTAEMPGYLRHQKSGVVLTADAVLLLPDVMLLGGDANNDCMINIFDLVVVAWNYGSTPPTDPRADINGNNRVDIFDLVMVGKNLDQACPGAWMAPSLSKAQSMATAHLHVAPAHQQVDVDAVFTVTLELEDVSTLYGVDVQLAFNPEVLEVVDADTLVPGVQIARGTFPNPAQGQVAKETADNDAGTVWYAVTLKNPAPPVSGNGTLCAITFRAKTMGYSGLRIQSLTLSDATATSLPAMGHDGAVRVGEWYAYTYLPILVKNGNGE